MHTIEISERHELTNIGKKNFTNLENQSNLNNAYIKSPLNYIGGKYKILNQILPLFPNKINNFIDLFAGGANVGVNVNADTIFINDNLIYLIQLYKKLQVTEYQAVIEYIEKTIKSLGLSLINQEGFINLRNRYNNYKNPLDLLILISYSFNHQIRFNSSHEYNNPFGKNRSQFNENIKSNLKKFMDKIQISNMHFTNYNFNDFNFSELKKGDFIYCDPPYLITTGTYNDGKRGFTGWNKSQEEELLNLLDNLNNKGINFALSNVIEHSNNSNDLLKQWIKENSNLNIYSIFTNYSNSNYQKQKNNLQSQEVLITNYNN